MFLPQEMTHVALVVPENEVLPITELLSEQGIFHHVDSTHLCPEADRGVADRWHQEASACSALAQRIRDLLGKLGADEGEPRPGIQDLPVIDVAVASSAVDDLEEQIMERTQSLGLDLDGLLRAGISEDPVESIGSTGTDLSEVLGLHHMIALLGSMPTNGIERLRSSLKNIPFVLETLGRSERHSIVLLAAPRNSADVLRRAARSAYLNPLREDQDYRKMPPEIAAIIRAKVQRSQQAPTRNRGEIEGLFDEQATQLRDLLWRVEMRASITETIAHYGRRRSAYLVLGWLPTGNLDSLTRRIEQASDKVSIVTETSERHNSDPRVPTTLRNPKGLDAFEKLVLNYGRPRYGEIDPTPLVALTFPLIFGIMFGDVGQGLLLALVGGYLFTRPVQKGLASLGSLILACGVAATLFGAIYGSVFGMEEVIRPLWIHPMEGILDILVFAVAVGAVVLNIGLVCSVFNARLAHDWSSMVFGPKGIAGIALYWSLIGLAVSALVPTISLPLGSSGIALIAGVAALGILFGDVLGNVITGRRPLVVGSLGTHLIKKALELFETLLSFFSNTLSYVRMGAFAVAHGGLSAVMFILAEVASPAHGVLYWIVVALGNIVIVGFEGLIVGIQTLRLEYYEFFSKFFRAGGTEYKPLRLFPRTDNEATS